MQHFSHQGSLWTASLRPDRLQSQHDWFQGQSNCSPGASTFSITNPSSTSSEAQESGHLDHEGRPGKKRVLCDYGASFEVPLTTWKTRGFPGPILPHLFAPQLSSLLQFLFILYYIKQFSMFSCILNLRLRLNYFPNVT